MRYSDETKEAARLRFLENRDAKVVALEMRLPTRTVQGWAKRYNWRGDIGEKERQVAQAISANGVERHKKLAALVDEMLEDTLNQVPHTVVVERQKAAQACRSLAETRNLIVGKPTDEGGEQRRLTLQQLIFIATGSGPRGNRIAGGVEDREPPVLLATDSGETAVSLGLGEEVIEAESCVVERSVEDVEGGRGHLEREMIPR